MASATIYTYLMQNTTGTTYTKLVDIKSYPDLGGTPEQIDVTTLSDTIRKNVNGVQELDSFEFTANYDKTDYTTLKALENTTKKYAVWFGVNGSGAPDGSLGKFDFEGELSVYAVGAGVNEARDMNISIALSSEIEFS